MESTGYGSSLPNNTEGVVNTASSNAHAAGDSIAHSADEATRKAKPKIDKVAAMAHQAVDKAADAAVTTAERLVERGESLNATQKRLVSDTCSYVSAHPWKSVSFGVLAGFLLSRILL